MFVVIESLHIIVHACGKLSNLLEEVFVRHIFVLEVAVRGLDIGN